MTIEKHIAAMAACESLTKTAGVKQKGGKNYLEVKHRVSEFRKAYGLEYGIHTQPISIGDKYVQVKALIVDRDGQVIGSGMAEEVRGQGLVNQTSALENAETSAIGRALASLGLHGGEYASANEMAGVGRKHEALTETIKEGDDVPGDDKIVSDGKPHDPSFVGNFDNYSHRNTFQRNAKKAIEECTDMDSFNDTLAIYRDKINACLVSPNQYDRMFAKEMVKAKEDKLKEMETVELMKAGMPEGFNNTK